MSRLDRILAIAMFAVMICAGVLTPVTALTEGELEFAGDVENVLFGEELSLDELEAPLADESGLVREDLVPQMELGGLELEADLLLDENLSEPGAESVENASSDFDISNGMLVKYNGQGGNVTVPNGVTSIGTGAFAECATLESVVLPKGVTFIGTYAFKNCTELTSISIPNTVTVIGEGAFYQCVKLIDVALPTSLTDMGVGLFFKCESLLRIEIPSKVTSIPDYAFKGCKNMVEVTLPNKLVSIGVQSFYFCNKLNDVTLPATLLNIGTEAFRACDQFVCVRIPAKIRSIGSSAFSECLNLVDIEVDPKNKEYHSEDGILYGTKAKEIISSPCMKTSVTIADGTKSIGDKAFLLSRVKSVFIPESVTNIGAWAFAYCHELNALSVPASVKTIGKEAFKGCGSPTEAFNITFYGSKVDIEADAFLESTSVIRAYEDTEIYEWAMDQGLKVRKIPSSEDPAKLSLTKLSLKYGSTGKLTVSGLNGRKVTWSTSNDKIATVKKGKVTAKNVAGKCTIYAKVGGGKTLKCIVTVVDPAELSEKELTISVVDSATIKLTGLMKRGVQWSSSRSSVAKITKKTASYVTIKAVKTGTTVISAKIKDGKTVKCKVKVVAPLAIETVRLDSAGGRTTRLHVQFKNQSKKNIVYIKFLMQEYNNQGRKLPSEYEDFAYSKTIKAKKTVQSSSTNVNSATVRVTYKIQEVRFSDNTTWKP